ncbi:hypothetical protein BV898_18176, partial [Hypsibius exemplaris]
LFSLLGILVRACLHSKMVKVVQRTFPDSVGKADQITSLDESWSEHSSNSYVGVKKESRKFYAMSWGMSQDPQTMRFGH